MYVGLPTKGARWGCRLAATKPPCIKWVLFARAAAPNPADIPLALPTVDPAAAAAAAAPTTKETTITNHLQRNHTAQYIELSKKRLNFSLFQANLASIQP